VPSCSAICQIALRPEIEKKRGVDMRFPKIVLSVFGVVSGLLLATGLPGPEATGSMGLGSSSAMSSLSTQRDTLTSGSLQAEFVPGQIIVRFRENVSEARIQEINRNQGTTVLNVIPNLKIYLLKLLEGVSPTEAARRYRELPEVVAADPNFVVRAATNDLLFPQQWYFENTGSNPGNHPLNLGFIDADIDAPEGWLVSMGDPSIRIAILDTGVDNTHPDLSGKVLASANWTTCPTWPLPDVNGHGTHVAGLAAALTNNMIAIAGTCPLCSLLNAKVLGDNGAGCLFDLQAGINWAVTNGANILNASLAGPGPCPGTLQSAINTVVSSQYNAIFVAAAGNNGGNLNTNPEWPAVCSNVVTVAATDARDDRAGFSNYGAPIVDIAAPGVDVISLQPTALGGGTTRKDGTSMAAPIVSGALGVIWANMGFPATANTAVINQMLQNADPIDGTVNYPAYFNATSQPVYQNWWEYGRLNLCRALGVQNCDPPPPKPSIVSAPNCPPSGGVVTLDLSTGTINGIDDLFGTQDSKWNIIQVPSSTHGQLPGFYPIGFYPAFSTAHLPGSWVPDTPNTQIPGANWIHPLNSPVVEHPSGFWQASSRGFYKYRVRFTLPVGTYTSLTLTGDHAEDDKAKFFLNGNQIIPGVAGQAGNFAALTPFTYNSSGLGFFTIGVNELVVEVENTQSVTGLRVRATLQATCAPPAAPAADLGDAPDGTNHNGTAMTAYPANTVGNPTPIPTNFPTVYDPTLMGNAPLGPIHLNAKGFAWLGADVSFEDEADTGPDQDVLNNINPAGNKADQDGKDDGVNPATMLLPDCALTQFKFSATNAQNIPTQVYINVWFDWTRDGDWDDILQCPASPVITGLAPEWAVQNYPVTLNPGFNDFNNNPAMATPLFRSINRPPGQPVWMRITLTRAPINAAQHGGPFPNPPDLGKGGSGPAGGYQDGETEDYFLRQVGSGRAEVCVLKFNDLNGNGVQNLGEPGLPGWVIQIKDAGGNVVATITTGFLGSNCTSVPAPATYTVSEVLLPGWIQTAPLPVPPGTHTVTVQPNQTVTLRFGNRKSTSVCDLEIRKTISPVPLVSGQSATITITVTSVGTAACAPSGIAGTAMQDMKPAGLTFTAPPSANQPGWQCSLGIPTGDASCGGPGLTLPPGYSVAFTIKATVTAPPGTAIQNCATVTNANDTNAANNQSCVTVPVVP
jgi:thermitase